MLLVALIKQAAVVQRVGVVRIERDRVIELGKRLVGFSGSYQRLAAQIVDLCIGYFGSGGNRLWSFGTWLRRQRSQIDRAAAQRDRDRCDRDPRAQTKPRSSGKRTGNRKGHRCRSLARLIP